MQADTKIGVILAQEADDLGEWLADAAAFDAAGAHALWIDLVSWPSLVVTAALAAVTSRSQLVVDLGRYSDDEAALAAVARLSRGRLRIIGVDFRAVAGEMPSYEYVAAEQVERWETTGPVQGREAWRATLAQAAEGGVAGLLVPAGPGLLDLLRNPGEPGQRHDLELSVG